MTIIAKALPTVDVPLDRGELISLKAAAKRLRGKKVNRRGLFAPEPGRENVDELHIEQLTSALDKIEIALRTLDPR